MILDKGFGILRGTNVVVGNAIEEKPDVGFIAEMAAAAHLAVPRPI